MAPTTVMLEDSPLLLNYGDERHDDVLGETVEEESASQDVQRDARYRSASSRYVLQLCVLTLIIDFCQSSVWAPLTAVFEEIICNHYYSSTVHSLFLLQQDCKVIPVQHELALVKGYKDAFSQIPSMLPRCILPVIECGEDPRS